jgi:hypothetical protein
MKDDPNLHVLPGHLLGAGLNVGKILRWHSRRKQQETEQEVEQGHKNARAMNEGHGREPFFVIVNLGAIVGMPPRACQ